MRVPRRETTCRRTACLVIGLFVAMLAPTTSQAKPVRSLFEQRREHVIVQQFDLSCGAAALTTLLNYQHGENLTEHEVAVRLIGREEYLANPTLVAAQQGFSLLDLKRVADSYGYEGIGYGRLTLDDLIAKAPIIVPISVFGYNHFVIFRGVLGDRVLLADPAYGNRTMRTDRFLDAWIDFGEIGKVGFVVAPPLGLEVPNLMAAKPEDFLILR
ncbi:C39 family peptidase [Benzoatithermus flavus]|uniref:C39 family peptidase n=1 Tax=Benzoatithermus flavus TaxID=3108223 RepID=A0ABU8XLR0_9PROT